MSINIFENDVVHVLPQIYIIYLGCLITIFGVVYLNDCIKWEKRQIEFAFDIGVFGFMCCLGLLMNMIDTESHMFDYQIRHDVFSKVIVCIIILTVIVNMLMSYEYFKRDSINIYEYVIIIIFMTIGLVVITISNDIILTYLGLELQSLGLYVFATLKQNGKFATEAGVKYMVLGAFASCMILFGITLVYGFTGLLKYNDLYGFFVGYTASGNVNNAIVIGGLLISVGLLFKVGAYPFHGWIPDIYQGAPLSIVALYTTAPKIVMYVILTKFILTELIGEWRTIFIYSGLLSIAVGGLGAIFQENLKRFLGYSAIGHTGYILLAVILSTIESSVAVYMYLLIYLLMMINLFSILLTIKKQSTYEGIRVFGTINELYRNNKLIGVLICLLLFSMMGMPPLSGFYGKVVIFFAIIKEQLFFVALFVIIFSVIGAVYYIKLIRILFFNVREHIGFYFPIRKINGYIMIYSGIFGVLFSVIGETINDGLLYIIIKGLIV